MSSQSPFPLEQALLGFLMQNPAHGYALHRRAEEELGSIWYMGISNVYGSLKDLEGRGEVESTRDDESYPPRKVYAMSFDQGRQLVSIDETIDIKIAALRAHASQMKDWDPEPRIKEWAAETAKGSEMTYAEAFRVITLVSDEDWEKRQGYVVPDE